MEYFDHKITEQEAILYLRRALNYLEEGKKQPKSFAPLNCDAMQIAIDALKSEGWKNV